MSLPDVRESNLKLDQNELLFHHMTCPDEKIEDFVTFTKLRCNVSFDRHNLEKLEQMFGT